MRNTFEKVKQLTVTGACSDAAMVSASLESPNSDHKLIKPGQPSITPHQQQISTNLPIKMAKSPTMLRQFSLGKNLSNINPALINSLFQPTTSPQSKFLILNFI